MLNLVKNPIPPVPLAAISESAELERNALATLGLEIQSITCAGENSQARDVCVAIRNHLKAVEAARTELTKPLLDGQRMLKRLADDHVEPLKAELDRIERLATKFAIEQEARAAADAKARMDLAKEATTEADFAMVVNEPVVAAQKAQGQQLKQILRWEVTDIHALWCGWRPMLAPFRRVVCRRLKLTDLNYGGTLKPCLQPDENITR